MVSFQTKTNIFMITMHDLILTYKKSRQKCKIFEIHFTITTKDSRLILSTVIVFFCPNILTIDILFNTLRHTKKININN